jgi:fatty acid desaturase
MAAWLNLVILVAATVTTWALLWVASHWTMPYAFAAAFLFSHVNLTLFALLHEAVHGVAAPNKVVNDWLGRIAGWTFPTSYAMQRVAHLGHHARNRTDQELFDYYLPGQSRGLRNFWLYAGNLFGMYWWSVVWSNFLYLVAPWAYRSRLFREKVAPALGFGPYMNDLAKQDPVRIWIEIALAFGYQFALIVVLDLDWVGLALCNFAFGLHWSALQYVDHAWSARDVRDGAWNLRVLAPCRWIALNYHLHLAHHRHPQVAWYRLPGCVDPAQPQPTFWRIYLSLWKGVRPAPPMGAPADLDYVFSAAGAGARASGPGG